MSFFRKLKKSQQKKQDSDQLNESYEGRFIREMNNEIEEGFAKKGEEIGMNEMCNNVNYSIHLHKLKKVIETLL